MAGETRGIEVAVQKLIEEIERAAARSAKSGRPVSGDANVGSAITQFGAAVKDEIREQVRLSKGSA